MFPGRMAVQDLKCPEWDVRFEIPFRGILSPTGESLNCDCTELIRIMHKRLCSLSYNYPVPVSSGIDTWNYRSVGESLYGDKLSIFYFADWSGKVKVEADDIIFERPLLREDLRFHTKSASPEYVEYVKWYFIA